MGTGKTRSTVRIGVAVAIVLLAGASTTVLSNRPNPDTIRCKDYVCTLSCGETPYISGVCKDGGRFYSAITIECCCCVDGANGNLFIGG